MEVPSLLMALSPCPLFCLFLFYAKKPSLVVIQFYELTGPYGNLRALLFSDCLDPKSFGSAFGSSVDKCPWS